jgi:Ser/Thr protein kinase RdoA (MazF antagonist)
MNNTYLKITLRQAKNILYQLYNIEGHISVLPGEVDFNFRVKIENEEGYILKISRPNENENYLSFQSKNY